MTTLMTDTIDPTVYPPVLSFAGPKFAGKGTASRLFLDLGYKRASFARPLKDMLVTFGLTEADISDPVLKETPHPLLNGHTPRFAMETLGTRWGRQIIWEDIWVNIGRIRVQQMVAAGERVVFDDVRFDNEAIQLGSINAPVVEITRPGCAYNPAIPSEAGLSRHLITATVANDGTPEQLHQRLHEVLIDLGARRLEQHAA